MEEQNNLSSQFLDDFKTIEEFADDTGIDPKKVFKELLNVNNPLRDKTKEHQVKLAQAKILAELTNSVDEKIEIFKTSKRVTLKAIKSIEKDVNRIIKEKESETDTDLLESYDVQLRRHLNQIQKLINSSDLNVVENLMKSINGVYNMALSIEEKEAENSSFSEKDLIFLVKKLKIIVGEED